MAMAGSSSYSAAGNALNLGGGFGATLLAQQVKDQVDEDRRKRLRETMAAGYSPASRALAADSVV